MDPRQDGQLLAVVVESSSETAFEELLRRHGPMVFNECRRMLAHDADAEDAAQAVFVVLWKKAKSLRSRPTVAAWLHRVARNVCRNSLRAKRARRIRERESLNMNQPQPAADASWQAIKEVLDEELERLPEKYRLPVILFHLEGRSLEEIGALLSMKIATLGTRLSRGREMLRARLVSRGVGLGTAALMGQIRLHAGETALPATFVAATARGANLFVAGNIATGAISSQSATLAQGAIKMLSGETETGRRRFRDWNAELRGNGDCDSGAQCRARQGGGEECRCRPEAARLARPDNALPAVVAQLPAKAADPAAKTMASKPKTEPVGSDVTFVFAGTVVRPDGQPADHATVRLSYLRKPASDNPPTSALTDGQGKFTLSIKRSRLFDALLPTFPAIGLIAEKDGFGFASESAADFETSGRLQGRFDDRRRRRGPRAEGEKTNVLKLVLDDVPVRGRLVNSEGRPIAGAKIEVVSVVTQDRPLDAWEASAKRERFRTGPPTTVMWQFGRPLFEAYLPAATLHVEERAGKSTRVFLPQQFQAVSAPWLVPAVRTDADGRFTLKGLGRDRIVEIVVSAPGIETTQPFFRTRPGELIQSHEPVYPSDFTLVATPAAPVTGRIVDGKTGRGLADVRIQSTTVLFARTLSDADGKYRLDGLPLGQIRLYIIPPAGSPHLAGGVEVKTALGAAPVVRDIKLTSGVLVRGRAFDKRTGDPVRGAIHYYALRSNPHLHHSEGRASGEAGNQASAGGNARGSDPRHRWQAAGTRSGFQ